MPSRASDAMRDDAALRRWCQAVASALVIGLAWPRCAPALIFGSPEALNSNAATDQGIDVTPRIVTDGTGTWLVSWQGPATDILVARSTDQGATWTAVASINPGPATRGGGVQLATDGATWVAEWVSGDPLGGSDSDLLTARSVDGGATWTAPQSLNANATTDAGLDLAPHLATDKAGTWVTAWQSNDTLGGTIGGDYDILFARSTDAGVTWTPPAALNTDAAIDTAGDADPRLATDGAGTWLVVWTYYGVTDRDIRIARSTDAGTTWSAPAMLDTNAATDVGDDYSPRIATDGNGTWVSVWTSTDSLGGTIGADEDILVARSTDGGITWTAPAALNGQAAVDSGDDAEAEVTTDGNGTWVTVWYGDTLGKDAPTDDDIRIAQSTDGGVSWTFPRALNDNASHDKWFESDPDVATDGAGTWLAVWDSQDPIGGTIGTDFDILVARGTEVVCTPTPESCAMPATPADSVLLLKDRTPDRHDLALWKWSAPGAPASGDLGDPLSGDPVSGTNYRFCIYDGTSALLLRATIPAGGRCGVKACWKATPGVKLDYRDRELTPDGIARIAIQVGSTRPGKLSLKATGENLAMPALGAFALPLRVQLQADTGKCWEATFGTPSENSIAEFRARAD